MNVASIIDDKGRNVVTIPLGTSLAEIAAILSGRRIGAVLVVEQDTIHGIISERDVVRAIAGHGADALRLPASDCMTRDLVTCTPDDTINDVMEKMTTGRFRHVPVVVKGKLSGIVSIGDIVKRRIEEVQREAAQIREYIATA